MTLEFLPSIASTHTHMHTKTHTKQTGVEYIDTASPTLLKALHLSAHDTTAEVIVCAGAIETPKLLLLSGIGDPSQLR